MPINLTPPAIGLILDFFNPKVLAGAQAYAVEEGIRLDPRWSVRGDWIPKRPFCDGVIYGIVDNDEVEKHIAGWKIPKLSLHYQSEDIAQILPNYEECGMLAAKELISNGAGMIINLKLCKNYLDEKFANGVNSFAEKSGVECQLLENYTKSTRRKVKALVSQIQSYPFPVGLCLPHAGFAYSLQEQLVKQGIRLPEDVSMIVVDKDVQLTPSLAPVPLTAIELDEWHRGYIAAEMVHQMIRGESQTQKHLLMHSKGITRRASTGHASIEDRVVTKTLKYLRKNYLKPIAVSDVVEALGFSRRLIENRFREVLNRGIHEELMNLRIQESKRRIVSAEESITSIAEACGFSSVHYFSSAFKRKEGISPKAYQKQQGSSSER